MSQTAYNIGKAVGNIIGWVITGIIAIVIIFASFQYSNNKRLNKLERK